MKAIVTLNNKGLNTMVLNNTTARHAAVIAGRTGSNEMGLMKSLLIDTLKAKLQTTAHFWYRKASTNEIREAWGTTNHPLMANKIVGTGYSGEQVNTVKYWDIEKGAFRSLIKYQSENEVSQIIQKSQPRLTNKLTNHQPNISLTIMKGVIYSRVSSEGDRQNTSRQVADLTQYANRNGIEILKVFEEHISGAKRNEEREVLCNCLDYCFTYHVDVLLISELSRLGRNVDEVLANVKRCKDAYLNIYFQKENLSIFQADGSKNPFLNIFISVLGTCAELERENIQYRLNSGRRLYIEKGGKLGRKKGSIKTTEQKEQQYKEVLTYLHKGYGVRVTSKLTNVSESTVQRLKKEFSI